MNNASPRRHPVDGSGLDHQIGRAFSGNATQTILLAAAFGSLSPFCSCGVVPIIAGLLVAGVERAEAVEPEQLHRH